MFLGEDSMGVDEVTSLLSDRWGGRRVTNKPPSLCVHPRVRTAGMLLGFLTEVNLAEL